MAILRRTKKVLVRAMYGTRPMEKKRTEDLNIMEISMLILKETVVQMAKANGVTWYGYVEGQEEARTTKEDVEDASGEGEWEMERLLLEWGKCGHPHLRG